MPSGRDLHDTYPSKESRMPWLSDDVPGWDELDESERQLLRTVVRDLGMEFPEDCDEEDQDYYE